MFAVESFPVDVASVFVLKFELGEEEDPFVSLEDESSNSVVASLTRTFSRL